MPAEQASVALTSAFRARLVELRRRAIVAVDASWLLELGELEESFLAWLARASAVIGAVQEQTAALSVAYVAAYVASELGEPEEPAPVDPADVAGVTMDGRPIAEVLRPALFTVKAVLAAGRSFEEASSAGRSRALRNTTTEVAAAADSALDDALEAEPRIAGWRRVTSARPCGACMGAATGAIQKKRSVLLRHPHCSCTKEPVVRGVRERIRRPTGKELFDRLSTEEQNRLFAGRGGADKAELVRSGAVDVSELVSVDRQALDGRAGILTETALEKLT